MNKKKLLAMLMAGTMVVGSAAAFAACEKPDEPNKPTPSGPATALTVWVSEKTGVKTTTEEQIKAFMDANPDYNGKYNITVEGVTESESATKMVTDVATGADIYCFAQDQIGRLVEANALSQLGVKAGEWVNENNDAGSVKAATVDNKLYCYPITSDNGYFMYYDKSVIDAEHVDDLDAIIQDCKTAQKTFAFELEGSAWYTASFFFGAGCYSNWSYSTVTKKWSVADNFNSDKGKIAMKGLAGLTQSGIWVNSSKAAEFGDAYTDDDGNSHAGGAAVVVTGTWDSDVAKEKLGDNYAVAKLPKYTVDGTKYQLGSYSGYKLMGVKPHTDTTVQAFCHALAQHLSGKDAQEARFDQFGWGPSNKEVQKLEKVSSDAALTALNEQNAFATPQGTINGGWWDFAKLLGTASKTATTDKAIEDALKTYQASLDKYTSMTEEAMNAFGVVGDIASLAGTTENLSENQTTWANWGTDFKMEKTEADGKVIWKTVAKITLAVGDKFKVRQGQSWDTCYGGGTVENNDGNWIVVDAEAGAKYIVLTITKDGDNTVGTVTLED